MKIKLHFLQNLPECASIALDQITCELLILKPGHFMYLHRDTKLHKPAPDLIWSDFVWNSIVSDRVTHTAQLLMWNRATNAALSKVQSKSGYNLVIRTAIARSRSVSAGHRDEALGAIAS